MLSTIRIPTLFLHRNDAVVPSPSNNNSGRCKTGTTETHSPLRDTTTNNNHSSSLEEDSRRTVIEKPSSPLNGPIDAVDANSKEHHTKTGRRVHFPSSPVTAFYDAPPMDDDLDDEDQPSLWYNATDIQRSKHTMDTETQQFLAHHGAAYRPAVYRMLERCRAARHTYHDNAVIDWNVCELQDMTTLFGYPQVRGLEKKLVIAMELPFHRQKHVIHTVLDRQAELMTSNNNKNECCSQQQQALASTYAAANQWAVLFAQKMGEGDAHQALLYSL